MARQLGILGGDAKFLLPGKGPLPVGVPAVVELARILVSPLLGHMVGGVGGTGTEVQEERLVRVDLLGIGDEADRHVGEVLAEVISLLGRPGWLNLVVVVDEVGVPLTRVAAQEAVEALEATPERPTVVGTSTGLLVGGIRCHLPDSSWFSPNFFSTARYCAANASFTSTKSICSSFKPARASAF